MKNKDFLKLQLQTDAAAFLSLSSYWRHCFQRLTGVCESQAQKRHPEVWANSFRFKFVGRVNQRLGQQGGRLSAW